MNQAIIVNYKILDLPIDTIAQYFSYANSCLPREGESGVSTVVLAH